MENNNLPVNADFYHPIPTHQGGANSLRKFLGILFRQKFYILGFFILTFLSVAVFTFLSPKTYQSEAKLFIQLGRESVSLDPSVVGPVSSVRSERESELNSEVSALKSRVLAEQTVDGIGARVLLNTTDKEIAGSSDSQWKHFVKGLLSKIVNRHVLPLSEIATVKMMKGLSVEAERQSHIINLAFEADSPELAQNVLVTLIERYRDMHIEMHRAQAPLEFIEKNADDLRARLEHKEGLLKNYQKQNSISSMDAQKGEILEQVSLLQTESDQVVSLIGASAAKIESIKMSLQGSSPSRELNRVVGRPNRAIEAMKERLFELRSQEADLTAHFPDTDRGLIDLREKIRLAEVQLNRESETLTEITEGIDTNYQSLQLDLANERAQLQAHKARQQILAGQIEKREASLIELSSHETSLLSLQREIDIANSEYQQYRENLQRAKISADLDSGRISNVRIVQPPTASLVPIKPRKALNLVLGLFLGIAGGLTIGFFREYFDSSIKDAQDVDEKLGLPVLASISRKEFKACT
jgi:uncharacterized protein involved in exopolysaccharide biosynthesis